MFATARPLDTGKSKQFRKGLAQLDEEGVVQVLRDPDWGDASPMLAAVGQLQFDVFANRLDVEFNAPIEILSAPYQAIRLTDEESAERSARSRACASSPRTRRCTSSRCSRTSTRSQRIEQNEPDLTLDHIVAG